MAEMTISEIEKIRRRADQYALKGVFCGAVSGWALGRARHYYHEGSTFWMIVSVVSFVLTIWGELGYFTLAWKHLKGASALFYCRRYVGLFKQLQAEKYGFASFDRQYRFSKWRFWRAKDLVAYEKTLCDYIRSYRRAEDLACRDRKWAAANQLLTTQLKGVFEEFVVPPDEQHQLLGDFSSIGNPRRRKEFLESMVRNLTYGRWVKEYHHAITAPMFADPSGIIHPRSLEDVRLESLQVQASKTVSSEANSFYQEGLKTESRRDRIRLFKRALNEDVKAAEAIGEAAGVTALLGNKPMPSALAEVMHISLQSFARERLASMESLVTDADWQMCREVLLVLAEPGRSGGRFKSHYYPEDSLKRMVRRQCDMYADIPFEPAAFKEAIKWLLTHGVVTTKVKTDERTISLLSHVKGAATPEAGKIIGMVLAVKRELTGVGT